MQSGGAFYLALVVALVFAAIGLYYLVPSLYHPLTADTLTHTTAHLKQAAVFWTLAALALVLGGYVRRGPRSS
jgi:hypothetical protein